MNNGIMQSESTNYDKAQELWHSFHNEVKYHHRYFPSHPVLDKLAVFAEQHKKLVTNEQFSKINAE